MSPRRTPFGAIVAFFGLGAVVAMVLQVYHPEVVTCEKTGQELTAFRCIKNKHALLGDAVEQIREAAGEIYNALDFDKVKTHGSKTSTRWSLFLDRKVVMQGIPKHLRIFVLNRYFWESDAQLAKSAFSRFMRAPKGEIIRFERHAHLESVIFVVIL